MNMLRYSVQLAVCCGLDVGSLQSDRVKTLQSGLEELALSRKVTQEGKLPSLGHMKGVAVSSGGSDHGGSDTCQSSSSDTTSVSEPCSPEARPDENNSRPGTPQPMPPIPPSLAEDDDHHHRHRGHSHHLNRVMDVGDRAVQDRMSVLGDAFFRTISERVETEKSRVAASELSRVAASEQSRISAVAASEQSRLIVSVSDYDNACTEPKVSRETVVAQEQATTREPYWCSSSRDAEVATTTESGDALCQTASSSILDRLAESKNERLKDDLATLTKERKRKKCRATEVPSGIKAEPEDDEEASCHSASPSSRIPVATSENVCKWHGCQQDVASDRLLEHMKSCHVDCQMENETYICLWVGCKVYNRPSCSVSWLQRHILSHGGNKPFKCIVDGCQSRFASQSALERHVNSHFNSTQSNSSSVGGAGTSCLGGKTGKSKEDTPTKLIKKRKLRYRRRCWAVKTEDYFDAGVMEHVRHNLMEMERKSSLDTIGVSRIVKFHSNVIARRIEESGKVKLLLHWTPEDVFPDSWIQDGQLNDNLSRSIPLSKLPRDALSKLDPSLQPHSRAKRRRK